MDILGASDSFKKAKGGVVTAGRSVKPQKLACIANPYASTSM